MTIPELDALLEAETRLIAARQEIMEMAASGYINNAQVDGLLGDVWKWGYKAREAASRKQLAVM